MKTLVQILLSAVVVAGCVSTRDVAPRVYDFGIPATASADTRASVSVAAVRAPQWLEANDMLYRLAYRDPHALSAYGASRWAGAPPELLTLRLRQRLGSTPGAKCVLSVDLLEFSQVFDAPDRSRAVIQIQAVLLDQRSRNGVASTEWRLEKAAPSADAAGGAAAFSVLAGELAEAVHDWVGAAACRQE
jgi:cholesterol transport system auxiliary component